MKKIFSLLCVLFICFCCFAIDKNGNVETTDYEFKDTTVKAGDANILLSFNDLTGVLMVTYTLEIRVCDKADAQTAIRDAVAVFAKEQGYFKTRLYEEQDDYRYFADTKTTRYKRFFILYDKGGMVK